MDNSTMIPRVTFDDLFPLATYGEEPLNLGVFYSSSWGVCWVCGYSTPWVSLSFEAHVCSAICDGLGWQRFWDAEVAANCALRTTV